MILERLADLGSRQPQRPALLDAHGQLSYAELHAAVVATAAVLKDRGIRTLGLLLDNSPAWVIVDLAALHAGIRIIPLPTFFSREQIAHAIEDAGIDTLCTGSENAHAWPGFTQQTSPVPSTVLLQTSRSDAADIFPVGTAKVTFTSGTTARPKGVCLGTAAMRSVAESIVTATADLHIEKHLCLLPLSLLLENIAGVYAPLLAGAGVILPSGRERGLTGSQQLDTGKLFTCLHAWRPHSLVLVPQMLKALTIAAGRGMPLPDSLRFVAVGGARVSLALLQESRRVGIPVYEGYGLSECTSVVALNHPGADHAGSVGKPLPHARLRITTGGEIQVSGATLLGYAGQPPQEDAWFATGDLGFIDADGYLHLKGRTRNAFITAYGRNVNPEWPESELARFPEIAQAIVFGEARENNMAIIQPASADLSDSVIDACVDAANDLLPDYARVHDWLRADAAFSVENGLLAPGGKPRRDAVWMHYQPRIEDPSNASVQRIRGTG
ncbi:MAG TPA: AMP-binding protein [Gammaproteobacteria bacterium]|nr:AMP-binding protein [Gammaproteobacteria bacterium]